MQTTWLYAVAHLSNGSVEGWLPENLSIEAGRCCRIFTDGDLSSFEARLCDLGLNDSDEKVWTQLDQLRSLGYADFEISLTSENCSQLGLSLA